MELNYKNEEIIEQLNLREQLKINTEKLKQLSDEINNLNIGINYEKSELSEFKRKLDELKGLKNILFNRKETKKQRETINERIIDFNQKLEVNEKKLIELTERLKELNELVTLQKESYKFDLDKGINLDNGVITINDYTVGEVPKDENLEVIVHCTDFFPQNKTILCNYDGNKECTDFLTYKGVTKQIKHISHRHTCHFVRNNVVQSTGDGFGVWEQPKYIIIDSFEPHKNQFVGDDVSDAWTYGSVELSDNAILLVREDEYKNIPKEALDNYRIIKYDGNFTKCTKNMLNLLGVKLSDTDRRYPGHFHSFEMACERSLNARNMAVNFIKDNSWDGKSDILFTEEELFALFEISEITENNSYFAVNKVVTGALQNEKISEPTGLSANFVKFLVNYGIEKSGNKYTLKKDDELYDELKELEERVESVSNDLDTKSKEFVSCYDFSDFIDIYEKYKVFQTRKESKVSNVDISNMKCEDLFKFKNMSYAKAQMDKLNELYGEKVNFFSLTESGCFLNISLLDSMYNYEQILDMGLTVVRDEESKYTRILQNIDANTSDELLSKVSEFFVKIEKARKQQDDQSIEVSAKMI